MNRHLGELFQRLNSPEIFDRLAQLNDVELRRTFGEMHAFGYQAANIPGIERILDAISLEMKVRENLNTQIENEKTAKENRDGFLLMKRLTYIAIGISLFQFILQFFDFFVR